MLIRSNSSFTTHKVYSNRLLPGEIEENRADQPNKPGIRVYRGIIGKILSILRYAIELSTKDGDGKTYVWYCNRKSLDAWKARQTVLHQLEDEKYDFSNPGALDLFISKLKNDTKSKTTQNDNTSSTTTVSNSLNPTGTAVTNIPNTPSTLDQNLIDSVNKGIYPANKHMVQNFDDFLTKFGDQLTCLHLADIDGSQLSTILAKCPNVKHLILTQLSKDSIDKIDFSKLGTLQNLEIKNGELDDSGATKLFSNKFPNLEKVTLTACKITNANFIDSAEINNFPKLKNLNLTENTLSTTGAETIANAFLTGKLEIILTGDSHIATLQSSKFANWNYIDGADICLGIGHQHVPEPPPATTPVISPQSALRAPINPAIGINELGLAKAVNVTSTTNSPANLKIDLTGFTAIDLLQAINPAPTSTTNSPATLASHSPTNTNSDKQKLEKEKMKAAELNSLIPSILLKET